MEGIKTITKESIVKILEDLWEESRKQKKEEIKSLRLQPLHPYLAQAYIYQHITSLQPYFHSLKIAEEAKAKVRIMTKNGLYPTRILVDEVTRIPPEVWDNLFKKINAVPEKIEPLPEPTKTKRQIAEEKKTKFYHKFQPKRRR